MADRNFNQGDQSYQSNQDWERERNRSSQDDWSNRDGSRYGNTSNESNRNRGSQNYRDIGYSGDSAHGMGSDEMGDYNQGGYNRVNYFPDNDDNRSYNDRDYENTQYGSSGTYGYRGGGMQDRGNYGRENRGSYGNAGYGSDYGNDWTRGRNERSSYGERYGNEGDWSRRHSQQTGAGNWGSDYGRQDWGRGNVNTDKYGDNQGSYGRGDYGSGYGNRGYDDNRYRNRYGGDTSNRGNANQGGVDNDWWDKTKDKVSSWFGGDRNEDRRGSDRNYGGGHRGKGPSDYRRSEDRIREDICDRLTDDDLVDASHVRVQIENDAVILSGTVSSREEKRRAEDLVESISGVRNVENRLRVGHGSELSSRDYTGSTDMPGGIGKESGTTNEIIRNAATDRNTSSDKGRNKTS